ncbi:MAG: hypothetical protein HRU25_14625, partial [Psychrobium sp.]|nr:hypothetical protein [Psychrobium sp.]
MTMKLATLAFTLALSTISSTVFASVDEVNKALNDNKLDKAQHAFSALDLQTRQSIAGKILQARLLFKQQNTEQSYDTLEDLAQQFPNNVALQYQFGLSAMIMAQKASIFSKMGYAKDGRKAWEKTVKNDPKHLPALNGLVSFHLI